MFNLMRPERERREDEKQFNLIELLVKTKPTPDTPKKDRRSN